MIKRPFAKVLIAAAAGVGLFAPVANAAAAGVGFLAPVANAAAADLDTLTTGAGAGVAGATGAAPGVAVSESAPSQLPTRQILALDGVLARQARPIPANAHPTLVGWACDDGYRRAREECVPLDMPENAFAIGGVWECSLGFSRRDGRCAPMTEDETLAILERMRATLPDGVTATPEDLWKLWVIRGIVPESEQIAPAPGLVLGRYLRRRVETSCRVQRLPEGQARLECVGPETWEVREGCVVDLSPTADGTILCFKPRLNSLLMGCRVEMGEGEYGRIVCSAPRR